MQEKDNLGKIVLSTVDVKKKQQHRFGAEKG